MRCPTTSGHYQCKHAAGHTGDCEADSDDRHRPPTLEERVRVLEAQVRSLQLSAPRGIE